MRKNSQRIIWVLIILFLILAADSFFLRYHNEAINKNVITVVDYREFWKSSNTASRDMETTLKDLQAQGVTTVAVKEMTLRDLAYAGEILLEAYGEFYAHCAHYTPEVIPSLHTAIAGKKISPEALVVICGKRELCQLLQTRLSNRFTPEELIHFAHGNQDYFIINAQLSPLEKTKNASTELDVQIGFDEELLSRLKQQGLQLVIRPGYNTGSNEAYLQEYRDIIRNYDINLLIFGQSVINGTPEHVDFMARLIKEHPLIIGVIETPEQIKYVEQKGLDQLMADTGYPINRVYSTSYDEFVKTTDERYYRWVRAVIDRGIRILYVVPFKDVRYTAAENLDDTLEVIGRFHYTISEKGFALNQPLNRLSAEMPGKINRLFISLSLLLAGSLYLSYLFRWKDPRWLWGLIGLGTVLCLGANLLLNTEWSKLYALAAAVLYPSLSSMLLLVYLRQHKQTALWVKIPTALGIILGVNALGAYTIVSSLADIRYIMNLKLFSGVKLSFLLPLLMFVVNYLVCFNQEDSLLKNIYIQLQKNPNYLVLLSGLAGAVIIYIYLGRSGNTSGLTVSSLEIRIREILENIFLARPRFKEIIIGYPALLAMVYLYHRYKENLILLVLGLGVVMGSISMVNSFCHVFTAMSISASRTLAGLLVGLIVGTGGLVFIRFCEWIYFRYYAHLFHR